MKGKMMIGAMAVLGMGTYAFMMYKKKNPNFMNDMKNMAKDAAYRVAYSLEEDI